MAPSDARLIDLFLDMLAAERGAAANTLAAYRRDLEDFSAWLAKSGTTVVAADSDHLRAHLGSLAERGFKASSMARRLSAIRQLYRFLYAEQHRTDDPAAVLEGPRRAGTLPKILSIDQVDRLLAAAREAMAAPANASSEEDTVEERALGRRLRAARLNCLVEVLYATG